uniref:Squalene cyclase C-terminal domain-containing protein n=1 Tax=Oryza punctata TaxID=4537 RepID=A0A0E0MEQ5_ORYPU
MMARGRTYHNSSSIRKACNFLLSKQLGTGGWGEDYLCCQVEVELDPTPLYHAAKELINMQLQTGEFPQQTSLWNPGPYLFGTERHVARDNDEHEGGLLALSGLRISHPMMVSSFSPDLLSLHFSQDHGGRGIEHSMKQTKVTTSFYQLL